NKNKKKKEKKKMSLLVFTNNNDNGTDLLLCYLLNSVVSSNLEGMSDKTEYKEQRAEDNKRTYSTGGHLSMTDDELPFATATVSPVLQQFVEGQIKWPPTYKFQKGSNEYHKKRVPAWCDRILWATPPHPCVTISQSLYECSKLTPKQSDHRPVFAQFRVCYDALWNPSVPSRYVVTLRYLKLHLFAQLLDVQHKKSSKHKSGTESLGEAPKEKDRAKLANASNKSLHSPKGSGVFASTISKSEYLMLYFTVSGPALPVQVKSTLGHRLAQECTEYSSVYTFELNPFFVIADSVATIGNGCLWITFRDSFLIGDADNIGACAVPLVDLHNLMESKQFHELKAKKNWSQSVDWNENEWASRQNAKDITQEKAAYQKHGFLRFKRDVTLATTKQGFFEGEINVQLLP
ncbi:hypothetical protein RFI_19571, partial [Reticulomyxa filosa]